MVARWKILVANFSFKNQNEENMFGAAMAIYTPTTDKPRRMNRMPAIYTQFHKTAKCFKSTLYLALSLPFGEEMYQIEKLPFGSLLCVQNNLSFRILSRRSMDRHIARTRPQLAAFLRIFAAFFFFQRLLEL